MAFQIDKIIIHDEQKFPMHDFGIYNFFRYSDNVGKAKIISTVIDDKYICAVDLRDKVAHWELVQEILDEFGEFDISIGSLGDEIYFWKNDKLTLTELNVILGILQEVKQYYIDTGISKSVELSCDAFTGLLKGRQTCENIDYVIDLVKRKIEEKKRIK